MDEIFSKFDGGSAAATTIRAGVDGDTLGLVTLAVTAGRKHIYLVAGGIVPAGGGYGVGPFGSVPWDMSIAPASAYTVLSNGVKVPNIATIGWGKEINDTFFTPLNTMMDRLTALGV